MKSPFLFLPLWEFIDYDGVPLEKVPCFFERFYQISEPEMKVYSGLGIGLYIDSEIIERHQGSIWVESLKGAVSTFSFGLPLLEDTSATA